MISANDAGMGTNRRGSGSGAGGWSLKPVSCKAERKIATRGRWFSDIRLMRPHCRRRAATVTSALASAWRRLAARAPLVPKQLYAVAGPTPARAATASTLVGP